ncbi:Aldo/keto reductase [Magnetospirillum sp. LM-5]|uniref:aldo/keto reductase family protein n=1 Tax=Magnetospirillum sp. LM-5 TaxID=2681466 RepID=UPI00137E4874|nr:aldo/keto reductase [Magnetospirillum sp. LM-5]CAA7621970.1 Aldo/keto reductase [Magnetospirillum sp. LM-5]
MSAAPHTWISTHGVPVPPIIYGTAWKKERTASLVEQALRLGFRGIDTACQPKHYDEAGVGAGLAAAQRHGLDRAELYLQTKFTPLAGHDPARVPYDPQARLCDQVAQSFARSRANLGIDRVDCLVLHSPLANPAELAEVWRAMEAIFDQGGARQLGISNCPDPVVLRHLCEGVRIRPAVVQNRFHAKTGYDRQVRDYCRAHGMIYQSFWTLTANPDILAHATVRALAAAHRRTAAQIFFRFLSQIGIVPLTGTSSAAHMQDDLAIADFTLDPPSCQALELLLG